MNDNEAHRILSRTMNESSIEPQRLPLPRSLKRVSLSTSTDSSSDKKSHKRRKEEKHDTMETEEDPQVNIENDETEDEEGQTYEREFVVQTQCITMSLGVWRNLGLGNCIPLIREQAKWISQVRYWASVLANCIAIEDEHIKPNQTFYSNVLQTLTTKKEKSHFTSILQKYKIKQMHHKATFKWSYFQEPIARQMKANADVHLSEDTVKARIRKTLMLYDEINGAAANKMAKCLYKGKQYVPPKKQGNNNNNNNNSEQSKNEAKQLEIFKLYKENFSKVKERFNLDDQLIFLLFICKDKHNQVLEVLTFGKNSSRWSFIFSSSTGIYEQRVRAFTKDGNEVPVE